MSIYQRYRSSFRHFPTGFLIILIFLPILATPRCQAFTTEDANNIMDAYNTAFYSVNSGKAYYKDTQTGGRTYFWGQAEEIEGQIDAYERTGSAAYKTKVIELLDGFSQNEGTNWSSNEYNDDIMWACIAYLRGYKCTSNTTYRSIAKFNFDLMYARAWDTNYFGGGLFWRQSDKQSKNACIEGPAAIAAYFLYQTLNDPSYLTKATNIFAWEKSKLFNASTGEIYDNIGTNGVLGTWVSAYNQGTFIGAAHYLGDVASATLAANYTMNKLGSMGWDNYVILPEYGIAGNNSGFSGIGMRWVSKFMIDRGLQSIYLKWMQANANAAWRVRRKSDNLSWCQWFHQSPEGTNFYSWDCSSSAIALQVTPPDATANILTASVTATPTGGLQTPLNVQFSGQASGAPATAGIDTTANLQGTITARGQNGGESSTNAFDDNIDSKWLDVSGTSWIQYQYSNNVKQVVSYYKITSGNDSSSYPERNPKSWQLQGSNNNGTNWTTLDARSGQIFSFSKQTLGFSVANPQAYNMYRLANIQANSGGLLQLDEIQFLAPPAYSYFWSFGDGTTSTNQNPQHTYANVGNYRATLVVSCDSYVGTNSLIVSVGNPLLALVNGNLTNGATPLTMQFSAQASGGNPERNVFNTTEDHRGTITGQGENPPNEIMTCAFDGSSSTKWLDFANADTVNRSSWIQYQYAPGQSYAVSQYAITTANDAPERDPKTWRLLASNDGGSSWVTLDTRTSGLPTTRFSRSIFSITNTPAGYQTYRLKIDSVANNDGTKAKQATCMQISEIELIGRAAYTYFWNFGDGSTSTLQNPVHSYVTNNNYLATLVVSDGVASTTNTMTVNPLPVNLGIACSATAGTITISWPAWTPSAYLYTTTNLSDSASWTRVANVYITNGISGSVSLPTTSENRFYQLRTQ